MTKPKPIFKKKEIVVEAPEKTGVNLGGEYKDMVFTVLYTGEQQELYKVGDKILVRYSKNNYDKAVRFFEKPLTVFESETYVICKLEE